MKHNKLSLYEPEKKTIFLLLTDTSSLLSKCIKVFNHQPYNHISLALSPDLTEVYSFGRLHPNNPVNGGFVQENVFHPFFRSAGFQLYEISVSKVQYEQIQSMINQFKEQKDQFDYNFLGLLPAYVNVAWERPSHFFCSEFVSYLLQESSIMPTTTPSCLIRPQDVVHQTNATLINEGILADYLHLDLPTPTIERLWDFLHIRGDIL